MESFFIQVKDDLARQLHLRPETVSKWFINRRVKLRAEGMEKQNIEKDQLKTIKSAVEFTKWVELSKKQNQPNEVPVEEGGEHNIKTIDFEENESDNEIDTSNENSRSSAVHFIKEKDSISSINPVIETELSNTMAPSLEQSEKRNTELSLKIPLWKQLYRISESKRRRFLASEYGRRQQQQQLQQSILSHIVAVRKAQKLPPVFAMISGPTIQPYRLEWRSSK